MDSRSNKRAPRRSASSRQAPRNATRQPSVNPRSVNRPQNQRSRSGFESRSIGEIRREERSARLQTSANKYVRKILLVLALLLCMTIGWAVLYNSSAFRIQEVVVNGADHLTDEEMSQLAQVPENATLLRVDSDNIKKRVSNSAWVQNVEVSRKFPHTLEINVTERSVAAVVAVPTQNSASTKLWAIASDRVWLMPIPDRESEAGQATSARIYEDADNALAIDDVPYGTQATIGAVCTDVNIINALDIVSNMTTKLADQVVRVSAADPEETILILDNGIEISFGKAENVREKERVVLQIMEDNDGEVSYINVRSVTSPTWRAC